MFLKYNVETYMKKCETLKWNKQHLQDISYETQKDAL